MNSGVRVFFGAAVVCLGVAAAAAQTPGVHPASKPAVAHAATAKPALKPVASHAQDFNPVIKRYCAGCHSDKGKAGGLSLAAFDVSQAAQNPEIAEKVIRKLQAGFMPPPLAPRPDAATYASLISTLESEIDAASTVKPDPGVRTFQRLNRPEYARAVRDLLALDVDAGNWLPLDTKSANFDNIADAQALSPTLLESYLNAASAISRMAVGDRHAPTVDSTYSSPGYVSQHPWDHVDGAPYGPRGGTVVEHVFPADAEYIFEVDLVSGSNARMEDIDVSVDGERVALIEYETGPAGGAGGRGARPLRPAPILINAGPPPAAGAVVPQLPGPHRGRRPEAHGADPDQGGPAPGRGRVRPQARRAVRGSDPSARRVVRRRRLRRPRHHDAAARARPDHQGTVPHDRHLRDGEPRED